jgi:predicted alpha/beta-fold hydrolase
VGSSQISQPQPEEATNDQRRNPWRVSSPFRPRRWLGGGHVQTVASFLMSRRIHLPVAEERLIEVAPGIKVRCWCHWQEGRARAMTLIVVHGLEGSSESQYMTGVARNGLAAGMNVVRMNQRNCGGMDYCAPTLYNSSLSGDVAAVARSVIENDGVSRFALVGFSMGGNLVLKCAGEWGSQGPPEFKVVAAVCPAMDLAASADALHERANRIYEWYFLMQLFRRMRTKAKFFPKDFDVRRLRGVTSLRLFDDRVTVLLRIRRGRRLLRPRCRHQRRRPDRRSGIDHPCCQRSLHSRAARDFEKDRGKSQSHLHRDCGRRALFVHRRTGRQRLRRTLGGKGSGRVREGGCELEVASDNCGTGTVHRSHVAKYAAQDDSRTSCFTAGAFIQPLACVRM